MAPALLGMGSSPLRPNLTRSASSESAMSIISGKTSSQARYSDSFTPPTSAADSESVASAAAKQEITNDIRLDTDIRCDEIAERTSSSTARSRRLRNSVAGTYNLKVLDGSTVDAPRVFQPTHDADMIVSTRRRTISGTSLVENLQNAYGRSDPGLRRGTQPVNNDINALDLQEPRERLPKRQTKVNAGRVESPRKCKTIGKDEQPSSRRATRSAGAPVDNLTSKLSILGKRGRNKLEATLVKAKRELRRLADTNEFAKIDTQPVVAEVWSNGKLVTAEELSKKRIKTERAPTVKVEEKKIGEKIKSKKRGPKVWLNKGLYAGQEARNLDWFAGYSKEDKKKMANLLQFRPNGILPLPMWHGQRLLHMGRHFKLPFDVCSPLPPGQPKPDEWRKVPKNRFVGDAAAAWKKSTVFDDFSSRCVCFPLNGCDESCQNRIMLYECDDGNCSAGREHCSNRAFTELQERRSKGGKYRIGVEVIKTADRGYGVRSNRCFKAHQIIVEYTGEIITEEECDRRMNEDYKDNECYYLMLFDQNMIIDATRGSIARFVNHSCEPNCRMVKWIVAGKPRMALFAGDRPIMTGEELTYDYNFDPFSAKNVQECRCGSENCRGVLGPRPKDKPKALGTLGETIKNAVKAGKRKLDEIVHGEKDGQKSPKKRKTAAPARNLPSMKAMSTAKGLKRGMPARTRSVATSCRSPKTILIKETSKSKLVRRYSSKSGNVKRNTYLSSRNSSSALVNGGAGSSKSKGIAKRRKKNFNAKLNTEVEKVQAVRSIRKRKLSAKGEEFVSRRSEVHVSSGKD